MAYKVDMEKAFDKMEWALVIIVLKKFRLPKIFISWIYVCLSLLFSLFFLIGVHVIFFLPPKV